MNEKIKILGSTTLLVIVLLLSNFTIAYAQDKQKDSMPAPTSDFYVNDFTDILSQEQREELMERAVNLHDNYDGTQVVVTIVNELGDMTASSYAHEMYEYYGVGKDSRGILILLSLGDGPGNRDIYVAIGKNFEPYIGDGETGRMIDEYGMPYFKENQIAEGVIKLQEAFVDKATYIMENKDTLDDLAREKERQLEEQKQKTKDFFLQLLGIILIVVVMFLIIFIIFSCIQHIKRFIEEKKELKQNNALLKENMQIMKSAYEEKIVKFEGEITENLTQIRTLESKLKDTAKWSERIHILYPDCDKRIENMIQEEIIAQNKQIAAKVENSMRKVLLLSPERENYYSLENVVRQYQLLSQEQKKYIAKEDSTKLKLLYEEAKRKKQQYDLEQEEKRNKELALSITTAITVLLSSMGMAKAADLRKLKEVHKSYETLPNAAKRYVDASLGERLEDKIAEAKRDKKRKEEEERRRKNAYYSSTSSNSSSHRSSSYGGHSGYSGSSHIGGGAGRKF